VRYLGAAVPFLVPGAMLEPLIMTHLNFDCVEPIPYTVDEFARLMRGSRREVFEMISRGQLKCITDGTRPRIPVSEVRRLVEEQLAIEEEIREDLARVRRGIDKNDRVEPEPYTIKEFARRNRIRPREVVEMISRRKLSCVTYGNRLRIPMSEMRRHVNKAVTDLEGVQVGIALAIRDGIAEEVGLDKHGNMLYRGKRSA
jgi:excisionase family DNA binding protein